MNKFIGKILKEATKNDDSFFQAKTKTRDKEFERRQKEVFAKIKNGVQSIQAAYKSKSWETKEEELFLRIFSNIHLVKKYSKYWNGYIFQDENKNEPKCSFNLKEKTFTVSYYDVWKTLSQKFDWKYGEIETFLKRMLNKYFKLNEFTVSFTFNNLPGS